MISTRLVTEMGESTRRRRRRLFTNTAFENPMSKYTSKARAASSIDFNEEKIQTFTEKNDWPVISHEGPVWLLAKVKPLDWAGAVFITDL